MALGWDDLCIVHVSPEHGCQLSDQEPAEQQLSAWHGCEERHPHQLCLCREPLFRQLCALHWLLEALTIDHTHHTMKPVITCWNLK